MVITPEQIDDWRKVRSEHQQLEFKEAKTQFDFEDLKNYCVALANEGGGHLVLGVANKPPRPVVGTRAFPHPAKTAHQLFQTLGFRVEVTEVEHPDGLVLVFQIPPRPRGDARHNNGRYLMRSNESLVPMSSDRLRAIFAEGRPEWLEEPTLDHLTSQQVVELLDTQTLFELLQLPYPSDQHGVIGRLVQERLLDESKGGYAIRRIGAILLAKRLDLFPDLGQKAARVVVYEGRSKIATRLDQPGGKGYAVGFQGLISFIDAQLPQNEVIEKALRKDVKLVPVGAVRELVANALIHQDFELGGSSVMIEIYSNRLEISNPGEPIVPVEHFINGYESRNPRLADLMRRMGICEAKGSGIDKVIKLAEEFQLPAPDFSASYHRTQVFIEGPKNFDDMDMKDRVRAAYQHAALKQVMREKMTNRSLRDRFNLPESKSAVVSQVIAAAIDAGLIKPDESVGSSRKYARYLPSWG
jgi:predicted HTH transcriptional regulator